MYLRKGIKGFELIFYRQKCLNWCQRIVNQRYLSEDNNENDSKEEKSLEKFDEKSELINEQKPKDKGIEANENLNKLLNVLKTKPIFGESDPNLKENMAKPKTHIRKSARKAEEEELNKNQETIEEISGKIDERLVLAAKGIAQTLSGKESKRTENQLLKLLRLQVMETNLAKEGKILSKKDFASLMGDMKISKDEDELDKKFDNRYRFERPFEESMQRKSFEMRDKFSDRKYREQREGRFGREEQSVSESFMRQKRESFNGQSFDRNRNKEQRINLFSGEAIGIFDEDFKESTDSPKLYIWDRLIKEELQTIVAKPPQNAFEEMIQWTEEGKLWKYPINNEQGLEAEENVPFYEHVLLDHLLLDGFPKKGPVRKFMELVVMGLSQNPYITVERKHATVGYYRQFFNEKEDMLRLSGALG